MLDAHVNNNWRLSLLTTHPHFYSMYPTDPNLPASGCWERASTHGNYTDAYTHAACRHTHV